MNERMIDLYKEACEFAYQVCKEEGRAGGAGDHFWNTLSTGRFAELLVRECISRIEGCAVETSPDDFVIGYNKGVSKVSSQVKHHFGIKE
jgi:hypothetical protein